MKNKEEKPPMTPEEEFCPNEDCHARGRSGEGNIRVHSHKEGRYICRECKKTFSATKGTVYYRMRKLGNIITIVVTLMAHGCSIKAIAAAFGYDERTLRNWQDKSGRHCEGVHEHMVERPRPLGQVQCDEMRIKAQGAVIWIGMAIMVGTRLRLGAEVSQHRDSELIEQLIGRVKRCASALGGAIWFCVDGLASYPGAIVKVFREKEPRGEIGRCRLVEWPNILIAQVIKQYEGHRLVGVTRKIYQGTKQAVAQLIKASQGKGDINTAFIERINGTFRSSLSALARRTRSLVKKSAALKSGVYLAGSVYNFCTEHESLRLPGLFGGR